MVEFAYQGNYHKTFIYNPFYLMYRYNTTLELNTGNGISRKKIPAMKKKSIALKHDFGERSQNFVDT